LAYLIVVLAAGVATAWWAGHKIGLDLSIISTTASVLGLTENASRVQHTIVGYEPSTAVTTGQHTDSAQAPSTNLATDAAQPAPYCRPGETPIFALGLADLKQRLGDTMGSPVECEHPASDQGDTVQQTTTGLAAYNHATNTVSFTDGWHHWALTPRGLATWEGTDPNPPTASAPQA
jgi:hypothetical protein